MTRINAPYEVIGISGKAGSGKDFITQHVLRPNGWYQFSLAWHFKVWLVGKGEATHTEVFVTKPPEVRKKLQLEGTEFGRMKYGDAVWTNTTTEWFNVLHENWGIKKFVVPDIRFPNEVEFVRNLGGAVYRVSAPVRERNSSLTEEARLHVSETALDGYTEFDGYFYNDSPTSTHDLNHQWLDLRAQFNSRKPRD